VRPRLYPAVGGPAHAYGGPPRYTLFKEPRDATPGGRYLLVVMLILLPGRDDRGGVAEMRAAARPVIRARVGGGEGGREGGIGPATVLLAGPIAIGSFY